MKEAIGIVGLVIFWAFGDMLHKDLERIAIATEARRAETPKSDSVHEGAGPQDITKTGLPS